jgi:hypothetical protein
MRLEPGLTIGDTQGDETVKVPPDIPKPSVAVTSNSFVELVVMGHEVLVPSVSLWVAPS